jgi:hypothetical protein
MLESRVAGEVKRYSRECGDRERYFLWSSGLSGQEIRKLTFRRGGIFIPNWTFYFNRYVKSRKDLVLRREVDRFSNFLLRNGFFRYKPFGYCSSFELEQASEISPRFPAWEGEILYFANPGDWFCWKKLFQE